MFSFLGNATHGPVHGSLIAEHRGARLIPSFLVGILGASAAAADGNSAPPDDPAAGACELLLASAPSDEAACPSGLKLYTSAARARVLQRCGWEVCTTADAIEAAVLGVEQAGAWEKAALVALLHAGAHEVRPCRLATAPSPCYHPHLATHPTSLYALPRPSTSSRPPSPRSTVAAPHAPPHSSPSVPPSCA